MSTFLQIHMLTSYPPSNLNRDDLGRPKTAIMGGAQRIRISSQSLKRAWRCSDVFEDALAGHIGTRTKLMGVKVYDEIKKSGNVTDNIAKNWAKLIAAQFGKPQSNSLEIEQLAHFSPEEKNAVLELAEKLGKENREPSSDELKLLKKNHTAADISLFGRMIAASPEYNREAAAQVAHAITVHKTATEDDYFTAVDDLNEGIEDMGAAHIGETEFAAGLFYIYICVNLSLLLDNLQGDTQLAQKTVNALVEAAATVSPTGKQNSFASRAYASYIMAERGNRQPRSLSAAFLKPVTGTDMLNSSITALEETRGKIDKVYGPVSGSSSVLNTVTGEGTLNELLEFASSMEGVAAPEGG